MTACVCTHSPYIRAHTATLHSYAQHRAIVKYDPDGVAAADPCGTPPPTPAPAARAGPPPPLQPQSPVTADVALTVAAAALHALAALCRCSRAAARHAYLAGVLDELLADEAAARRLLAPPQTAAAAAAVGWPVGGGGGGGGVPGAAAAAAAAAAKRLEALRAAVVELYLALAGSCGVRGSAVVLLMCVYVRESTGRRANQQRAATDGAKCVCVCVCVYWCHCVDLLSRFARLLALSAPCALSAVCSRGHRERQRRARPRRPAVQRPA